MTDQDPVEGRRQEIRARLVDAIPDSPSGVDPDLLRDVLAECDRLSAALGARERELKEAKSRVAQLVSQLANRQCAQCGGSVDATAGRCLECDERDSYLEAGSARLLQALEGIKSQCAGHADEFSGRVWRIADDALASCVRHPGGTPEKP